jgi:Holliday junction resolvase RusA-like endonuclease
MLKTREAIRTQVKGDKLKGALLVVCEFLLPLRKDVRGKKRTDQHGNWHSKKRDGDNLEKFVNDACQNIVWVDDAQVACMFRTKRI